MQPNLSSKFVQYFGVQYFTLHSPAILRKYGVLSCPLLAVFLTSWNLKALLTRRFRIGTKRSNFLLLPRCDLSQLAFRLHKAKLESLDEIDNEQTLNEADHFLKLETDHIFPSYKACSQDIPIFHSVFIISPPPSFPPFLFPRVTPSCPSLCHPPPPLPRRLRLSRTSSLRRNSQCLILSRTAHSTYASIATESRSLPPPNSGSSKETTS